MLNIAGKNDFGALSCPGNDGFNLMRGEILRFINNEQCFAQTATTDISQCLWLNPLLIGQFEKDIANIAKKPHIFAKQGTTDGEVLNRLLGGESALTISS